MHMKKPVRQRNKAKPRKDLKSVANFLFEAGMLARTPRSGFMFLGSGDQSVAEHLNRVCYIGFVLASVSKEEVDMNKVLKMCLFHDFAEARTSDLNYVHQKYAKVNENAAIADLVSSVPFGESIRDILHEYEERQTRESRLAKDSDNLELLLSLKEQADIGNERALTWIPPLMKRFLTPEAFEIAETILSTDSDEWWYGNKGDQWWVTRNKTK